MQFLLDSKWNTRVYTKINTEIITIPKTYFFFNSWETLAILSSTVTLGVESHCGLFLYLFIYSWPDLTRKRVWPLQWINCILYISTRGTRWRSWLRLWATSRKVVGSIPDGVTEIIHWRNPSGRTMTLVDSASNRNEYQEYFLGVKAAGA